MKSQHWQNFKPSTSEVTNFIGGIRAWNLKTDGVEDPEDDDFGIERDPDIQIIEWPEFKSRSSIFGGISYELRVGENHNGWHHTLSFVRSSGAGDRENFTTGGILKADCPPGVYQMFLHFQYPMPKSGPQANEINNFEPGQFSITPRKLASPSGIIGGEVEPYFVARPYLVNPSNGSRVSLWDSPNYGFPITLPHVVNPY